MNSLRRIVLATLLLVSLPAPLLAAIAVRQALQNSTGGSITGTQYPTAGLSITVLTGSYIWVVCGQNSNGTATITVPTDGTNTYTQLGSTVANGANGTMAHFWTGPVTAGTYATKCNYGTSGLTFGSISEAEITGSSGPDTSGTYHKENTQSNPGTGVGAVTSTNLTPSTQPGLLISVSYDTDIVSTVTADTSAGFTALFAASTFYKFSSGTAYGMMEYQVYSSTSAIPALFTAGGAGVDPTTVAVLFVQTASGGTAPTNSGFLISASLLQIPAANDPRMSMDRLILPQFKKVA